MAPVLLSLIPLLVPVSTDAYGDRLPPGAVARLGSVRWRCPDPPEHLIWSPDGKYLVGTHGGRSLTVWAYPAGVVVRRFELSELLPRYSGPVELPPFPWTLTPDQVRWMPDGRRLLVYGGENRLARIDVPTGRQERIDTGGHRGVAVALSVDGRRALMEVPDAGNGGDRWSTLCVLDLARPQYLHALWNRQLVARYVHLEQVQVSDRAAGKAQMTPDGRFIIAAAASGIDDVYTIIDLATGRRGQFPEGSITAISVAPNGRTFLAGDALGPLTRWAFVERRAGLPSPLARRIARVSGSRSASWQFSPDGRAGVTVGWGDVNRDGHVVRTVTVLDVEKLQNAREWDYRPGDITCGSAGPKVVTGQGLRDSRAVFAVAPDNRTLAVASPESPRLRFFDLTTGAELRANGDHAAAVVALRRVGSKLISVGSDHGGRAWNLPGPGDGPDARRVGRAVEVFDRWDEDDLPPPAAAHVKVLYNRDENCVEARDSGTEAVVWERNTPAFGGLKLSDRPKTLPIATDPVWDRVAFAAGETVMVCDLTSAETVAEVRVPGCWPTAVEFGPQPDTLFVGYHDGQVLVWDLRPGDLPRRPPTEAEFAALWADLGGSPRAAARTRSAFLDDPAATLRWLDAHLRPLERPTDYDIDLWLAKLAHPRFAQREEATRQLVRHFDVAGAAVRELIATTRSTEVEHRLRLVIDRQANLGGDGEVVRLVRAVNLLERIGSPEATKLLLRLARGGGLPAVRAAEALVRMKERDKTKSVNQPQNTVAQGASAGR